jgi:hypothetical protein
MSMAITQPIVCVNIIKNLAKNKKKPKKDDESQP